MQINMTALTNCRLFCSFPFFGEGNIGAGVTGIVIAAALGVFGYVTMKKAQGTNVGLNKEKTNCFSNIYSLNMLLVVKEFGH